MLIKGPLLRLRPITVFDFDLVVRSLFDWPEDRHGKMTLRRCMKATDTWVKEIELIHAPLTDDSMFWQALVIFTDAEPNGIGIHAARADGKTMVVTHQAFDLAHRGLDLFAPLNALLQKYGFDVLQMDGSHHQILDSATAAKAHVDGRDKYEDRGTTPAEETQTKQPLHQGGVTRAGWEKWNAAHPEEAEFEFTYDDGGKA